MYEFFPNEYYSLASFVYFFDGTISSERIKTIPVEISVREQKEMLGATITVNREYFK